jgi:uncharacterized protein YndB with AHSA1/START domain
MKAVQWALVFLLVAALAIIGTGFMLPSRFEVKRSATIGAPAARIYELLADPKQWAKWGPWAKRDPNLKVTHQGPESGVGARFSWDSSVEGRGSMEFTRVDPGRRIEYTLAFIDHGMDMKGVLDLEPAGNATVVTWSNEGDVGANPLRRYLALVAGRLAGPDFEEGLARLKQLAEKGEVK